MTADGRPPVSALAVGGQRSSPCRDPDRVNEAKQKLDARSFVLGGGASYFVLQAERTSARRRRCGV